MAEQHIYAEGQIRHTTAAVEELLVTFEARRPAWYPTCLVQGAPPGRPLVPELGENPGAAKKVCRRCLVLEECQAYAVADESLVAVWGGTSKRGGLIAHPPPCSPPPSSSPPAVTKPPPSTSPRKPPPLKS